MNPSIYVVPLFVITAVLLVMGVVVGTVHLLVKLGELRQRPRPDRTVADRTDPEIVAVLTAAATAAVGQPVLVHRVHIRRDAVHPRWAQAGRMDIMLSHRVEPRR